ncbi:MAG: hypothetical protein IJG32_03960 [Selenomonadaceae bacterium]|nr:hypothetical protein [Selenomonadaceae bacterium]
MFESTADKVLRVLIDNNDKATIEEKISAIKSALPSLSDAAIYSAIAQLSKEGLIATLYGDNKLRVLKVQPYALSRLMTKREFAIWNIKWDVAKIALGYALGFVSAWLLK